MSDVRDSSSLHALSLSLLRSAFPPEPDFGMRREREAVVGVGCAAACECEQRGIPSVALTSSSSSVACDEEEGDYEGVCRCGCSLDPTL